jgi:hypothetical protein
MPVILLTMLLLRARLQFEPSLIAIAVYGSWSLQQIMGSSTRQHRVCVGCYCPVATQQAPSRKV